jgi:hypothetical protein
MATKIDQIALKYQIPSHKNIPNFQIQVTQKYTKIGHFGVQSYVPSGNPVYTYWQGLNWSRASNSQMKMAGKKLRYNALIIHFITYRAHCFFTLVFYDLNFFPHRAYIHCMFFFSWRINGEFELKASVNAMASTNKVRIRVTRLGDFSPITSYYICCCLLWEVYLKITARVFGSFFQVVL